MSIDSDRLERMDEMAKQIAAVVGTVPLDEADIVMAALGIVLAEVAKLCSKSHAHAVDAVHDALEVARTKRPDEV